MKNERGITLVEVLATLVLVFVIGSLVFSITMSTYENYKQSELRTSAHRQINLFLAQLTTIHQNSNSYLIIKESDSNIQVDFITRDNEGRSYHFDGTPFTYDLFIENNAGVMEELTDQLNVDLSRRQSITIKLVASQPGNNRFRPVEVTTNIYRLTPARGE